VSGAGCLFAGNEEYMEIKSFKDLRVWQLGMDLVVHVYRLTEVFPKQEAYGLSSQMQRAAVSVPSNIAEGHTREHGKEYLRHISISQSSLAELETQLEIAMRLGYLSAEQLSDALSLSSSLGKQLYALRNAIIRSLKPESGN
jgi:four helix bundle protein